MVTLEEFVNEVKNTTEPWLKERTEHGIGPRLIYSEIINKVKADIGPVEEEET